MAGNLIVSKPLRIGVAGLGTVGGGVLRLLRENADVIARRAGRRVEVHAVSARDRNRKRPVPIDDLEWYDDPVAMAESADIDVVVELIGGSDGVAKALVEAALDRGIGVVTANKALIAIHGHALAERAEAHDAPLAFEAAVAGAIPIIKAMREGLSANRFSAVTAILNGTCNYILTQMRETGQSFASVLEEAQKLGYAEADPSFDVDGIDAAHKLAILASIAFGRVIDFPSVHIEGIRQVTAEDIVYAAELGYRIKLLAIARDGGEAGIEQRVHPCMVPADAPIAHVEGVFNAVVTETDGADRTMIEGRGAGEGPTASAVIADIVDIARGRFSPVFGVPCADLEPFRPARMQDHRGPYYMRCTVSDRPGVIADIAAVLSTYDISIESFLQRGRSNNDDAPVPVVIVTHETQEAAIVEAVRRIDALASVREATHLIRIETFAR